MTQELKSFGKQFSDRRQELQLSLKEAESATSIRISYLEAIEAGQIEKLISPIYAQGFSRQYAIFLGLDGDRIISDNAELFNKPPLQEFSYGIGTLETRGSPGRDVKWLPNFLWIVAFFILILSGFFVMKSLELI
jgi:cytoskeletal protein RodZ